MCRLCHRNLTELWRDAGLNMCCTWRLCRCKRRHSVPPLVSPGPPHSARVLREDLPQSREQHSLLFDISSTFHPALHIRSQPPQRTCRPGAARKVTGAMSLDVSLPPCLDCLSAENLFPIAHGHMPYHQSTTQPTLMPVRGERSMNEVAGSVAQCRARTAREMPPTPPSAPRRALPLAFLSDRSCGP